MTSKLLFTFFLLLIVSCSSKKQIEKALYSGNYNQAIQDALVKLESNKDKERKQDFVILLKTAFEKAVARDLKNLNHLKKDGNPEHYKNIYDLYLNLEARQEAIKPVLPLKLNGKNMQLDFTDYTDAIVDARHKVSDYAYNKNLALLDSHNKQDLKEAYRTFQYIDRINPNYRDTRRLMQDAHYRGTDHVIVSIENQTEKIIPRQLEDDLLNFDIYGLNQFWTVYHANPSSDIDYDFAMALQLKRINVSPEKLNEQQFLRKKEVVDGWTYQLDRAGNVAKDTLGNDIKIDKIVNARARYSEYSQLKSTQVLADVVYIDLKNDQTLDVFPITSEFVFENRYATYKGDKRALDPSDLDLLQHKRMRFPSDADMVYDTGEDLKLQLKQIIGSYKIRP